MAENPLFEEAIAILKKLTGKKHIRLLSRGNEAIRWALEISAALGKDKVLIQDQGGWLTYLSYPKKFGMKLVKVKTDYGLLDPDDLMEKCDNNSILLVNSMPGYFICENMAEISAECKHEKVLVVNDVSGSIGSEAAKYGDIIVGSFGRWKPVEVGEGGFIASNEKWFKEDKNHTLNKASLKKLVEALKVLKERMKYLVDINKKVKQDLDDYDLVHRAGIGFNVAVKFKDEEEKKKIIKYCKEKNLDCTICPRYIRVNDPAICIEIKRKNKR